MGENICNSYIREGVIFKLHKELIQLNSKKPKTQLKMDKGYEQTFFQRRHMNGQQVHEKVLHITNHQGNANQNHTELTPHTR